MRTLLLLAAGCFLVVESNAQQTTKTTPHKTQTASLSPEKSKMLCKAWKLDSVEQFGVQHPANAKEKGDGITFVVDGSFFVTSEGVAATGTWKCNGSVYIYTSSGTPENKMMYKIMGLADNRLALEYQTPDLIRIHYVYSPK
ncbi:MAG TPA: hypothetical protein VNZ45_06445 [Bacteroidia bacterium]|jgi:hypothetical protein|nr:hypothetical protein [Bacteroidia bacterium]